MAHGGQNMLRSISTLLLALVLALPTTALGAEIARQSGSSLGPNVINVCPTCVYTSLQSAADSIPLVSGTPPDAMYQLGATQTEEPVVSTWGVGATIGLSYKPFNLSSVRVLMKKVGNISGNITAKLCYYDSGENAGACSPTETVPNGALYSTGDSIAVSSTDAFFSLKTFTFSNTTIPAITNYGTIRPNRMIAFVPDAEYNASYSAGVNYVSIMSVSNSSDEYGYYIGTTVTEVTGVGDYTTGNGNGGVIAVYGEEPGYSEFNRWTINLSPGIYVTPSLGDRHRIPPHVSVIGSGQSATVLTTKTDTHTFYDYMGDNDISNLTLGNVIDTNLFPWRGDSYDSVLRNNTSTSAPFVDIPAFQEGNDFPKIGDIFLLSQPGLPTTFYRITAMIPYCNSGDCTTYPVVRITADRNIDAVYTVSWSNNPIPSPGGNNVRFTAFKEPTLVLYDVTASTYLNAEGTTYRKERIVIANAIWKWSSNWNVEMNATSLCTLIVNGLHIVQDVVGSTGTYDASGAHPVAPFFGNSGGLLMASNIIHDITSDNPISPGWLITANGGTSIISNYTGNLNATGSPSTFRLYQENGGALIISGCFLNTVAGTWSAAITKATGTVKIDRCNAPAPTFPTNGECLHLQDPFVCCTGAGTGTCAGSISQLTASPAHGSGTGDGGTTEVITVPGVQTGHVCNCVPTVDTNDSCIINQKQVATASTCTVTVATGVCNGDTISCTATAP